MYTCIIYICKMYIKMYYNELFYLQISSSGPLEPQNLTRVGHLEHELREVACYVTPPPATTFLAPAESSRAAAALIAPLTI